MPISRARLRISDYNEHRKSRLRKQERRIIMVSLSLTSMVDMFAILVIFLLANTSTVTQWIEVSRGIELPKARASDPPPKAVTLQIAKDGVYGDDRNLARIPQVMQSERVVEPVRLWLAKMRKKESYVNIVAHTQIPYGVIRRIVATCQEAGFKNVNLAVQPK